MKKNMGTIDRSIRMILAIVMATLYFTGVVAGSLGLILIVISAVFVLTSFVGTCPLYLPFGISTLRKNEHQTPTR